MNLARLKPVAPQLLTLLVVLAANWLVFPQFFAIRLQDGRLFGAAIDVLVRGAPVAILAIGMTLVIATKGVDLSVGAIIAICGAVAATLAARDVNLWLILVACLATGIACGLWNGILVAILDIQPIIATLILMVAGRGIAQLITEGQIVTFLHPGLEAISASSLLTLPMPVIITAVLAILMVVLVRKTALGLLLEAIGVNRQAATFAGVESRAVIMSAYVISGICGAVAGLIICSDIKGADANNAGLWLELDAILAVVLGGTSLMGGRFSILMSIVGAATIQSMNAGILLSGYPPEMNLIVKAIVIIAILILQSPGARMWVSLLGNPGADK